MNNSSLAIVIDLTEERNKRMPRSKKSKADEIDDLVDDLDELDEEDPDEKPARKSRKKSSAKKPAAKKRTGIGTKEVAEEAGVEQRKLRAFLRAKGYQPRDDRDGRYEWKSLNDPEVKRILRDIAKSGTEKATKAETAKVKGKKTAAKKSPAKKRRSTT